MTNSDQLRALRDERVQKLFGLLGDKWTLSILAAILDHGKTRFTEVERITKGISQRMLAKRLKSLEHYGFIKREIYREVPARVDYEISEQGKVFTEAFELFVRTLALSSENLVDSISEPES